MSCHTASSCGGQSRGRSTRLVSIFVGQTRYFPVISDIASVGWASRGAAVTRRLPYGGMAAAERGGDALGWHLLRGLVSLSWQNSSISATVVSGTSSAEL